MSITADNIVDVARVAAIPFSRRRQQCDAEDARQDAAVRLWESYRHYSIGSAVKYARRTIAGRFVRLKRNQPDARSVMFCDPHEMTPHRAKPGIDIDLHMDIESLPAKQRDAIEARLAGETFVETAKRLGMTPPAIKYRYEQGVQTLRNLYGVAP